MSVNPACIAFGPRVDVPDPKTPQEIKRRAQHLFQVPHLSWRTRVRPIYEIRRPARSSVHSGGTVPPQQPRPHGIGVGVKLFARNSIQFSQPSLARAGRSPVPVSLCAGLSPAALPWRRAGASHPLATPRDTPRLGPECPISGRPSAYSVTVLSLKSRRPLMIWLSRSAPIVGFDLSIYPACWPLHAQ
jgi:hypothetical protein